MSSSAPGLTGEQQLEAISTSLAGFQREQYGRDPTTVKAYAIDDMVVVVVRPARPTPLEQTMEDEGRPEYVVALRHEFDRVMASRYVQTVRDVTGREVVALLSQTHVDPHIIVETFFLDGRLGPAVNKGMAEVIPIVALTGDSQEVSEEPG